MRFNNGNNEEYKYNLNDNWGKDPPPGDVDYPQKIEEKKDEEKYTTKADSTYRIIVTAHIDVN